MARELIFTNMNINFFISLITAVFIGGSAGYVGSLMTTKKMSLAGDVLSHIALPGVGLGLLFGLNVSLGALGSLVFGILLIWWLSLKTDLSMESLVGVVFVLSMAVGFLIIPEEDLLHALFGNIYAVSLGDAIVAVIASIAVLIVAKIIYPKMMLACVSEDLALSSGVKTSKYNLIYLFLIATVVAFGIKVGGTIFTSAMIIIPSATARNMSNNMRQYSIFSAVIGLVSVIIGFTVFSFFSARLESSAIGTIIALAGIVFFAVSLAFKNR